MLDFVENILSDLTGTKPEVPKLTLPDISKTQIDTAEGNLAVLPLAQKLGSGVNAFNLAELAKALEFWSPGSLQKVQGTLAAQLSGELEVGDTQSIIRSATAAGYGKGFNFGAGGIGRNLVMRDLGIGVQQQKQRGFQNLLAFNQASPQPFNVTSMFFTPQQRLAASTYQAEQMFNRDWLEAQVNAAPSPLGQFIQNVVYAVAGTAGSYFGVANGGGAKSNAASAGGAGAGSGTGGF